MRQWNVQVKRALSFIFLCKVSNNVRFVDYELPNVLIQPLLSKEVVWSFDYTVYKAVKVVWKKSFLTHFLYSLQSFFFSCCWLPWNQIILCNCTDISYVIVFVKGTCCLALAYEIIHILLNGYVFSSLSIGNKWFEHQTPFPYLWGSSR